MADVLVNDETNEAVFLNEATNAWVPSKLLTNEAGKRIAWDGYAWVPVRDKPKPEKPPQAVEPGAFGRFGQGAARQFESLVSSGKTAYETVTGENPEEVAKRAEERQKKITESYAPERGLEDVTKAYREKGLLSATGEVLYQVPGAVGSLIPTLAGGAIGGLLGGPAGAIAAVAGPSFVTQLGSNLEAQFAEQARLGKPIDPNQGAAAIGAVAQAGLDTVGFMIPFGKAIISPIVKTAGKGGVAAAEKLAAESITKTLAKGTATGILAEVPTEVAQQMIERYQADKELFSDDAQKEYGEIAYKAAISVAPLGGPSRMLQRGAARRASEAPVITPDDLQGAIVTLKNDQEQKVEEFDKYSKESARVTGVNQEQLEAMDKARVYDIPDLSKAGREIEAEYETLKATYPDQAEFFEQKKLTALAALDASSKVSIADRGAANSIFADLAEISKEDNATAQAAEVSRLETEKKETAIDLEKSIDAQEANIPSPDERTDAQITVDAGKASVTPTSSEAATLNRTKLIESVTQRFMASVPTGMEPSAAALQQEINDAGKSSGLGVSIDEANELIKAYSPTPIGRKGKPRQKSELGLDIEEVAANIGGNASPKSGLSVSPTYSTPVAEATAIVNRYLEKLTARNKQGAESASALRGVIFGESFDKDQALTALKIINGVEKVMGKAALTNPVGIRFFQKMGDAAARTTTEDTALNSILEFSLAPEAIAVAGQNYAHETMHVLQDLFKRVDPQAHSVLNKAFPEGMNASDIPSNLVRFLKRHSNPSTGNTYWGDMEGVLNTGNKPASEHMAYVFGAINDIQESGVKMDPSVGGAFVKFANFIKDVLRSIRNSVYTPVGVKSLEIMKKLASGERQKGFAETPLEKMGAGEQRQQSELSTPVTTEEDRILENKQAGRSSLGVRRNATEEQIKTADDAAKYNFGRVVWQNGDLALFQTHSITGKPIYKALKGSLSTNVDIDQYTGKELTNEQRVILSSEKNYIENIQQKEYGLNPSIKYANGTAFSESLDKAISPIAASLRNMLGIKENIFFSTVNDAASNENFVGPERVINTSAKIAKHRETLGLARRMEDGNYLILVDQEALRQKTKIIEVLSHEIGHIFEKTEYKNASSEVKAALRLEFNKWLDSNKSKTAREHIDSMRPRGVAKLTTVREGVMSKDLSAYWRLEAEWFADQVSKWATTSERPVSVIEKYFRKIADAIKRFFNSAKGRGFLPNETFKQYLDGLAESNVNNLIFEEDSPDTRQSSNLFSPPSNLTPEQTATFNEINGIIARTEAATAPVGDRAAREVAKDISKGWFEPVKKFFDPLRGIGDAGSYRLYKGLTHGTIDTMKSGLKKLVAPISKATKDHPAIYTYMTTPGASPSAITDPEARAAAVKAKRIINGIQENLVKRKIISKDEADKYADAYLPRMFLAYLKDKRNATGMRVGFMDYTKSRVPLSEKQLMQLGEVKDPAYLISEAIFRPVRDMAILNFYERMGQQTGVKWVVGLEKHKFEGAELSLPAMLDRAESLLEGVENGIVGPDRAQETKDYANRMRNFASDKLQQLTDTFDAKLYKKIPNDKRYGSLRSMWIRKEIYEDVLGQSGFMPSDAEGMMKFIEDGSFLGNVQRRWKQTKVPLNPPTVATNIMSNIMLASLSGHNLALLPYDIYDAMMQNIKGGKLREIAQRHGFHASNMSEAEMKTTLNELQRKYNASGGGIGQTMSMVRAIGRGMDSAADFYGTIETVFKMASVKDGMRKGLSEKEAVLRAQKWLFDYSEVNRTVKWLRNIPFGSPFITWTYKVIPLMVETALSKNIVRFAPFVGAYYLMSLWATEGLKEMGGDDEDKRKLLKRLPERVAENKLLAMTGAGNFVNIGKLMPFEPFFKVATALEKGSSYEVAKSIALMGGPIADILIAFATGKDQFTGRDIVPKSASKLESPLYAASFLANEMLPAFLKDMPKMAVGSMAGRPDDVARSEGLAAEIIKKLSGVEGPKRSGFEEKQWTEIGAAMLGINVYNPTQMQYALNVDKELRKITNINADRNEALKDPRLSPDERRKVAERYAEKIREAAKEIRKFTEDAALSPGVAKNLASRQPVR